jgi:hypothetical protein
MNCTIELTDTFGGEANYSWVDRKTFCIDGLSEKQVIRKARKLVGLTGVKTVKTDFGEMIQWDFPNACVRAFLIFNY